MRTAAASTGAFVAADRSAFYAVACSKSRAAASAFFEEWQIDAEPAEAAIFLDGDVG